MDENKHDKIRVTCVFLRVSTVILHFLMTPFIVRQSEDRVDAVPGCAARRFRQDDVLAVLRRSIDELLGIHCERKSKSVIPD